jgi:hypothetical protein
VALTITMNRIVVSPVGFGVGAAREGRLHCHVEPKAVKSTGGQILFWQPIFSRMSLGLIKLGALVGCNETLAQAPFIFLRITYPCPCRKLDPLTNEAESDDAAA